MNTGDIGVGSFIRHNGELCLILEYQHRTPGNLRAFFQAKMRNVKTNKLVEYRFRAGEDVELVRVEQRALQYLYKEGENLVLMDTETFEQLYVGAAIFGDSLQYLKEEVMVANALFLPSRLKAWNCKSLIPNLEQKVIRLIKC